MTKPNAKDLSSISIAKKKVKNISTPAEALTITA